MKVAEGITLSSLKGGCVQAMPPDELSQSQLDSQTAAVRDFLFVDGVSDRLGNITAPTLIMAGQQDDVLGYKATIDLFNR